MARFRVWISGYAIPADYAAPRHNVAAVRAYGDRLAVTRRATVERIEVHCGILGWQEVR